MVTIDASAELLEENKLPENSEFLARSTELVEGIKGFEDDTIQMETALTFERFKQMYDDLTPALGYYDELETALKAEKEALLKLKKDIDEGNGKRHKYDEYLSFEEKKVTKLESVITLYAVRWKKLTTTYDELHNEINEILVERFTPDGVQ